MVAVDAEVIPAERRPEIGPIAVLPVAGQTSIDMDAHARFTDAVRTGGGEPARLSDATRGLVWLSPGDPSELVTALDRHPRLEWVQLPWAGVDSFADILSRFAGRSRPLWTSAKGAYSQPVAEHALALTLALLRVFPDRVRATSWSMVPEGRSLYGMSVVVIGAGGIVVEFLRLLRPFGVRTTVVRRSEAPMPGADRTVTTEDLPAALPDADVVVVAAALTGATIGLIGETELAMMKPDAVLINIARGGLVDTEALTAALASRQIGGAGVDVTDPEPLPAGHPLWSEPRIIITPHSADTPEMTAPLLAERIRLNTAAFVGDGRFIGVVDPAAGY